MKSFKNFIAEMAPPPDDWDTGVFKTSFKKQIEYAVARAAKLGSGSSRVVFDIEYKGRMTALKIAKNGKGLAQNEKEADWGMYQMNPSVLVPLIDVDEENDPPRWLHFEKAEKLTEPQFKSMYGFSFESFANMLQWNENERTGRRSRMDFRRGIPVEEQELIEEHELYFDVTDLMANFDILAGDLGRVANWGVYKGNAVIIDAGFDPKIHKEYYMPKPKKEPRYW